MCAVNGSPSEAVRMMQGRILAHLRGTRPFAIDLVPRDLPHPHNPRSFIAAAIALQDSGLIMYEALLIGTGPEPCLRDAVITHKGLLAAV